LGLTAALMFNQKLAAYAAQDLTLGSALTSMVINI
jgi:hypothetical protein